MAEIFSLPNVTDRIFSFIADEHAHCSSTSRDLLATNQTKGLNVGHTFQIQNRMVSTILIYSM